MSLWLTSLLRLAEERAGQGCVEDMLDRALTIASSTRELNHLRGVEFTPFHTPQAPEMLIHLLAY